MVLRIGHRGASGYACGNTLEAFERAINMGVDMIELDVRHTKDNVPVIFHDRKLHRVTDGKGKVKSMNFKDIRKLWKKNGEKIITIEEALAFINNRCMINIELKSGICKRIMKAIYDNTNHDNVIVSSFFKGPLLKVRKMDPEIKIGVLRKYAFSYRRMLKWCEDLKAYSFHPYFTNRGLTKRNVKRFQKHGYKVLIWHVENRKKIAKFKRWGVDGIMSDYPERV